MRLILVFVCFLFFLTQSQCKSVGSLSSHSSQIASESKNSDRLYTQDEAMRILSMGEVCNDENLHGKMESTFHEQKKRYRLGGIAFNNFKKKEDFDWQEKYDSSPRELYLEAQKHELRQKLRKQIFHNAINLYDRMAVNDFGHKSSGVEFPRGCSVISQRSPQEWSKIQDLVFDSHQKRRRLKKISRFADHSYLQLVLLTVYEIQIIEKIYLKNRWKKHPFWEGKSIGDEVPFPPLFPVHEMSDEMQFASERLKKLYHDFPILRRVDHYTIGYPKHSLAEKFFRDFFLTTEKKIEDQLVRDLTAPFEHAKLLARQAKFQEPTNEDGSKRWLLAHLILLRSGITKIAAARTTLAFEKWSVIRKMKNMLQSEFDRWEDEAKLSMVDACNESDAFLEELSSLTSEYFLGDEGNLAYGHLDAFCHSGWGKSSRALSENYTALGGGASFVIGAMFPPTALVALPVASVLATTSFATGVYRTQQALAIERSLGLLSFNQQKTASRQILIQGIGTVFMGSMMKMAMQGIHAGGAAKYFIPFFNVNQKTGKLARWDYSSIAMTAVMFGVDRWADVSTHLDEGKNPMTSKMFWQNTAITAIGTLFFGKSAAQNTLVGQVKGIGITSAVYLALSYYVQNINYRALGMDVKYDLLAFDSWWSASIALPKTMALIRAKMLLDLMGRKYGKQALATAASVILTISQGYIFSAFYFPARNDYVEGESYLHSMVKASKKTLGVDGEVSSREWKNILKFLDEDIAKDQFYLDRLNEITSSISEKISALPRGEHPY